MPKIYVLDTNVLLSDPNSLFSFEEHEVILPLLVLEELDRQKSRQDEVGGNARSVSRKLDDLRKQGSLTKGISLPNGGVLKIAPLNPDAIIAVPVEFRELKGDNLLIAFMLGLKKSLTSRSTLSNSPDPILVSKDINVRIKCDSLDIRCEDYRKMRVASDVSSLYSGVRVLQVEDSLIESFYENKNLSIKELSVEEKFFPNQIIILKSTFPDGQTQRSAITKCVDGSLLPIRDIKEAMGMRPRNKEQSFSLDLLFDDSIRLVTLIGQSGCGKTCLALAAALEQLKGVGGISPKYNKLIVTRPIQPLGKDIGFLPGTLMEKMEPWIAPIRDNLSFLMGGRNHNKPSRRDKDSKPEFDDGEYLSLMIEKGLIEVEAITFIRGRSIPEAIILVDEAQNLSMHELKTILTRVGEGTKVILTGDIEQIDNTHVDAFSNGLTYAVEKFKEYAIAGHVTLVKGERSQLATLSAKIL